MKRLLAIVLAAMLLSAAAFPVGILAASDVVVTTDGGDAAITATGVQDNWYKFDLSAFGTPGFVYALYFDDNGTVSFDAAVQLTSFDAAFNMTTADIAAGEVVSVADINGYSYALGTTGNSVCFVQASNPGNYTGLVPDQPLSAWPGTVDGASDGGTDGAPAESPPAPTSELPPELASAVDVGVWPAAAGTYDPTLDASGIPSGVHLYLFMDATSYSPIAAPTEITGYANVGSVADLTPGTWTLLNINSFDYVVLLEPGAVLGEVPASPDDGDVPAPAPAEPAPAPAGESGEVYITIVANGKVEVAAQPVLPDTMTVEGVLLKAHETWYSGGVSGYAASIDPTYNMYLVSMAWGISGTPYNSQGDGMVATTVDTAAVKPGDNIIMTASGAATAATLKASESENAGEIIITATDWALDFTTFQYMGSKISGGRILDSAGNELGTTGGDGTFVLTIPGDENWDGVVILEGKAAINVLKSISAPAEPLDGNARTVYFTVKLDTTLAPNAIAVPVKLTKNTEVGEQRTIEGAIKRFHELYYNFGENGLDGYAAGAKIWGVEWKDRGLVRPKLALNDKLIDISDTSALEAAIKADDNFLISISTNAQQAPIAVYLDIYINSIVAYGDAYVLEYGTNGETVKTPLGAGYALIDAETPPNPLISPNTSVMDTAGEGVLTDENGHFEVNTPTAGRVGIVVLQGLTACNTIYSAAYPVFKGPDGFFTLWLLLVGVGGAIPLGIIVAYAMRLEIRNRGIKYSKSKLNTGGNLLRNK
ncbi:MAG: hypothetical protein LBD49_04390 [Oscillospiraceae bacterium]|jgi:hypothetical protein|nr:hypothetical protein [Oscillospiraceae bacterium]